ncbi:cytoplasmic protein [Pisolithus marmoratus]|nr:cytoplasmic protein [Pisolithus marmoratus]
MVLFFSSTAANPPVTVYMGRDKTEDLIKYAWPQDVWFHVDKLSSAHVYLRMPDGMNWEAIPQPVLVDCAQLVKANSIEVHMFNHFVQGTRRTTITVIYTPADNLKKQGDMAVGQVAFHNDKRVKRTHVPTRENPIVNRLNKTKIEKQVDHEQERIERVKKENAEKRAQAAQRKKEEAELARQRAEEKAARSYDSLFNVEEDPDAPKLTGKAIEEDFM